jgi:hypothetical protein
MMELLLLLLLLLIVLLLMALLLLAHLLSTFGFDILSSCFSSLALL